MRHLAILMATSAALIIHNFLKPLECDLKLPKIVVEWGNTVKTITNQWWIIWGQNKALTKMCTVKEINNYENKA